MVFLSMWTSRNFISGSVRDTMPPELKKAIMLSGRPSMAASLLALPSITRLSLVVLPVLLLRLPPVFHLRNNGE